MASAAQPAAVHDDGSARPPVGWPEVLLIDVWLMTERAGDSIALCVDFDIVAKGPTREAAFAELEELVAEYLESAQQEGLTYIEALRIIPLRERLRLHALGLLTRLVPRRRARESSLVVRPHLRAC